jgi:mono/diheme cytochrome c family protein
MLGLHELGDNGQMPAFGGRLNDVEIKVLVAWVLRGAQ